MVTCRAPVKCFGIDASKSSVSVSVDCECSLKVNLIYYQLLFTQPTMKGLILALRHGYVTSDGSKASKRD